MLDRDSLQVLAEIAGRLEGAFASLPEFQGWTAGRAGMSEVLHLTAERLADNFPYFHPLYAGQMLKPPHPVARLAYALALWINPNNHALDGGRATSRMEKEAVAELAAMLGWREHLGHLTGGGTMANLEALWVAGRVQPGKTILASEQAHYTHSRISGVLQLPFESVACDARGRMDLAALRGRLVRGGVGTVVATLGTTATGSVDPLAEILELRGEFGFRVHVDAAYGGYFALAANLGSEAQRAFEKIAEADSIVIDPHKHGLQPYGCGCVLFRDPAVGRFYKHDSPYTYFSSSDLHLGEISLECSRPGAAAAALWATQKLLPLVPEGEFAAKLSRGRQAALRVYQKIANDNRFLPGPEPELDILVWAVKADTLEESSRRAKEVFDRAARQDLHLALAQLPAKCFGVQTGGKITCLRSVLMKPEHLEWADEIWNRLSKAAEI